MGGGKRKYQKRGKYVPKEKKLGKFAEEKPTPKDQESVKKLIALWESMKKKASPEKQS